MSLRNIATLYGFFSTIRIDRDKKNTDLIVSWDTKDVKGPKDRAKVVPAMGLNILWIRISIFDVLLSNLSNIIFYFLKLQ